MLLRRSLKITYRKTFTYSEKFKEDRAEYLKQLEKIPVEKRTYVYECGINCLVREYGRSPRRVKIEDTKRGKKFERTNVISARTKNEHGKITTMALFAIIKIRIANFSRIVQKTLVKSIERGSTKILDRASFHRKTKLKNLARRHGMKIFFSPAYSPNLNPIEKDWANI
jgi:hypothetical protein